MRVTIDERTGIVSLIFSPTCRAEAERILEYAIRLYRREQYDVSAVVEVQQRLIHEHHLIQ